MIWLLFALAALGGALLVLLVISLYVLMRHLSSPYTSGWPTLIAALLIGMSLAVAVLGIIVIAVQL